MDPPADQKNAGKPKGFLGHVKVTNLSVSLLETEKVFQIPEKQIKSPMDMARWEKSECYYDILGFVSSISIVVQNKKLTDVFDVSPKVQKILDMIQMFENLARETPPIEKPQRFGNVAFRAWFEKMKEVI